MELAVFLVGHVFAKISRISDIAFPWGWDNPAPPLCQQYPETVNNSHSDQRIRGMTDWCLSFSILSNLHIVFWSFRFVSRVVNFIVAALQTLNLKYSILILFLILETTGQTYDLCSQYAHFNICLFIGSHIIIAILNNVIAHYRFPSCCAGLVKSIKAWCTSSRPNLVLYCIIMQYFWPWLDDLLIYIKLSWITVSYFDKGDMERLES